MRRAAHGSALLAALAAWASLCSLRGFVVPSATGRRAPLTGRGAAEPAIVEAAAELSSTEALAAAATAEEEAASQRDRLKVEVLRVASASSRGERASPGELGAARAAVESLEALNPTSDPTLGERCAGTWELAFADTQLFRSSPFFMAGRALCGEGDEANRYDWFCDMHRAALQFTNIGKVRQVVSSTSIVSEFEVEVGAAPVALGYPVNIDGAIVSTANIAGNRGDALELMMESVEIKGSNVPLLRQALDGGLKLRTEPLGRALESVVSDRDLFPEIVFRTTYLDSELRVSRDQDGKIFVYTRVSDSTTPTDYEDAAADLGIPKLLDGAIGTILR